MASFDVDLPLQYAQHSKKVLAKLFACVQEVPAEYTAIFA